MAGPIIREQAMTAMARGDIQRRGAVSRNSFRIDVLRSRAPVVTAPFPAGARCHFNERARSQNASGISRLIRPRRAGYRSPTQHSLLIGDSRVLEDPVVTTRCGRAEKQKPRRAGLPGGTSSGSFGTGTPSDVCRFLRQGLRLPRFLRVRCAFVAGGLSQRLTTLLFLFLGELCPIQPLEFEAHGDLLPMETRTSELVSVLLFEKDATPAPFRKTIAIDGALRKGWMRGAAWH